MRIYTRPLKSVWLKAAAVGGFWGAIEIILGSYLHNLHVPMAGTFLTFLAVMFLTIFSIFWDDPGLALKASIIAALIKSISPSAVLIGPMTAIILEGFLFEVGVSILGRNLAGFILAGILTELSVVFHKIISLLIIYSIDLIKIAENFYNFLTKLLYIQNIPPLKAFFIVLVLYSLLGTAAALIGYFYGKKLKKDYTKPHYSTYSYIDKKPFETHDNGKYDLVKLLANILITSSLLWTIAKAPIWLSVSLVFLAIIVAYKTYPNALRMSKKTGFWIQILIFWILAAFFYNELNKMHLDWQGIIIGLKLVLRALVIILFFSVLSIQIRAPLIKSFLLRKGLNNLYLTLKLATSTLPQFLEHINKSKNNLKIIRNTIYFTVNLVSYFEHSVVHRVLFVVEGEKDGGKTQFMKDLAIYLAQTGFKIGGILTMKKYKDDFLEYYVYDIETGANQLLCTNRKIPNPYYKTRHFYFSEQGVKFGNKILTENSNRPLILVDEVGILELRDLGWSKTLENLLTLNKYMVWSVRKHYTNQILWKYFINEAYIFDIKTDSPRNAAITITKKLFNAHEN